MVKEKVVSEQVMSELGLNIPEIQDEHTQMYKEHLSLLIARGKTKEFIGKIITYSDLDRMSAKDLEKNYKLYEAAQASRINQSVTNGVINAYTQLCGFIIKPDKKQLDKLNSDLRNDFLVTNQLEQWTSLLSFKLGGFMSLISASLITFENLHPTDEEITKNLSILNGDNSAERDTERDANTDANTEQDAKSKNRKHKKTKNSETD